MAGALNLTIESLISGVYDEVGNPSTDILAPTVVLGAVNNKIQHYRNEMNLTDEGWYLSSAIIRTRPDTEIYAIDIPDFARPFFVETWDSNRPKARRREVEMARGQDRNILRVNTEDYSVNQGHTARFFNFFNLGEAQGSIQILPIPTEVVEYRVWFETVIIDQPRLLDAPRFMPAFFPLIKCASAIHVLPFNGMTNEEKAFLLSIRMAEKMEYYAVFERYVQEVFHAQAGVIMPAGASRRARRES